LVLNHDLQPLKSWRSPAKEPATATIVKMPLAALNMRKHIHSVLHFGILVWTIYISTGKYTVKGQYSRTPISPTISLKNGSTIAMKVQQITKIALESNLKRLSFKLLQPRIGTSNSFVIKSLSESFCAMFFSINGNRDWQSFRYAPIR